MELVKATQLSRALDESRSSAVEIKVISNLWDSREAESVRFWELLGIPKGTSPPPELSISKDDSKPGAEPHLFEISDASGTLEFKLVYKGLNLSPKMLQSDDVMLFDCGFEIIVWEGSRANKAEKTFANEKAPFEYISQYNRPENIAIYRCLQEGENEIWNYFFKAIN